MSKYDKEYEAFQIFEQIQETEDRIASPSPRKRSEDVPANADPYYEIEYDSCPMPGVGRFVLKSQKIETPEAPEKDEIRELFQRMRDIARQERALYFGSSRFYDRRVQQENAGIFYRQGMFMKDFEDDYEKTVPYSSYFPNYQMMGYDQLRTYFTWRTRVRRGDIGQVSLSYAFLYLYELLNNIGVENPGDGLERLMTFWEAYRVYDRSVDKYVPRWLKDYHIYYELPHSFREFVDENNLGEYYPGFDGAEDRFELLCAISKYDIRKSAFYTEKNRDMIKDCFLWVLERIREAFAECRIVLDEFIFQPTKSRAVWTPFQGALFSPVIRQPDRRVILSEREIYVCSGNRWTYNTVLTTESGKRLVAYCLKQTEAVLRELTKYKYRLCANKNMLSPVMADELRRRELDLETIVTDAVRAYYREVTKTVVRVDNEALEKIRREALATQERLIVPEQGENGERLAAPEQGESREASAASDPEESSNSAFAFSENPAEACRVEGDAAKGRQVRVDAAQACRAEADTAKICQVGADMAKVRHTEEKSMEEKLSAGGEMLTQDVSSDPWSELKDALTPAELQALRLILDGSADIRRFADECGVMLEILIDGINEKAADCVGDSLLADEYTLYEDYAEQVKGMVITI